MPEKRKFKILKKKIKMELLGEVEGSISEVFGKFPNFLPAIDAKFKPMPVLISQQNEFISYSFLPKEQVGKFNVQRFLKALSGIILKFEETELGRIRVWGYYSDKKRIKPSFAPTVQLIIEGRNDPKFFKINENYFACSRVTTIKAPAKEITEAFPREIHLDPIPNIIFYPFRILEMVEGDYIILSSMPPAPHIVIKIEQDERTSNIFSVYFFILRYNDKYYNTNLETKVRKIIFDIKNKLEKDPEKFKEAPLTILKRRLAQGEITEEEFIRKKKLLE